MRRVEFVYANTNTKRVDSVRVRVFVPQSLCHTVRHGQVEKHWPSFCKNAAANAKRSVSFVKDTNGSGNGEFLRTR